MIFLLANSFSKTLSFCRRADCLR